MKIHIAGNGAWGKALFFVISKNTKDVSFWNRGEIIGKETDVLVLAVPTNAIRNVLSFINTKNIPIIINASKGIEEVSHKLPFQIVEEVLGKEVEYFSLMGPGFSQEVLKKAPTLLNLGYIKDSKVENIKRLFETPHFRIHETNNIKALELAGAFKNIYAIVSGFSNGLGYKLNTSSMLLVIAIEELQKLCGKLEFGVDFKSLPGVIGDLILTCNSEKSRNFTFGSLLTEKSVSDSLKQVEQTVEGYYATSSVGYFEKLSGTNLPLASLVKEIIRLESPKERKRRFVEFVKAV